MPNIASAKKALRVSKRRQKVNSRVTREFKDQIKTLKSSKAPKKEIDSVYSKVDLAVKKGVIHSKKAARIKSKLSAFVKNSTSTKK